MIVNMVEPNGTPSQRTATSAEVSCHVHHRNLAPVQSNGAYSSPAASPLAAKRASGGRARTGE